MSRQEDRKSLISPKSGSAKPSGAAYPQAALRRFTESLDQSNNPELKRFHEINKGRVQEFIRKPFEDAPALHEEAHPKPPDPQKKGFFNYSNTNYVHVSVDSSCPEFQRSLGNRSRFGDGDGSFWDKWVNTEIPTRGLGVDEHGLPLKNHADTPTTGFKRLYMNRSHGTKNRFHAKTTVEPYDVRRERRLKKEREGAEVANESEKMSTREDFSSSQATIKSPEKMDWREVDRFEVNENGQVLLNDEPMQLPPLTSHEKASYFGSKARFEFLEIFRQLSRQRYNFKDNKFMTMESVIENVNGSSVENVEKKIDKLPKTRTMPKRAKRFSSVGEGGIMPKSMSPTSEELSPSPGRRMKPNFQRQMSTEKDPIEVTEVIEEEVAQMHLTLPKDGPAKFSRPLSPRHRFILGCISSKMTPRPSLLIRKDMSTILNLEHQNIGDKGGILLANALDGLPYLCSLNIADNNLTDAGLTAIIKKLPACPLLTCLDVSENKIDAEAADELSSYLLSPSCALIDIVMRKSDVDDNEIGSFVQSIGHSNKLMNVDLSANLIGSNQRTLREGLTMGGVVLGEMLCDRSCKIKSLKLAWNMIRFESGVALVQSLRENISLTYLDISYNGIGDDGAETLGDAIQVNSTLQTILLSNNNITSTGCFCIVEGIKVCKSLTHVDLTNNPIGQIGAKAVMTAILDIGSRVKIDIRGCSIARRDDSCWYDLENPSGQHTLSLSNHYSRAVAMEMLRACAQSNGKYVIEDAKYVPDVKYDTRGPQSMQLTLRRGNKYEFEKAKVQPPEILLTKYENDVKKNRESFLEKIESAYEKVRSTLSVANKETYTQLQEVISSLAEEKANDDILTKRMTCSVLECLGYGGYDWLPDQMFSVFDPLGMNYIELGDLKHYFLSLLPHYLEEWTISVESGDGDCYYEYENEPYSPGTMGSLQLSVVRHQQSTTGKQLSTVKKILTQENINNLLSSLKRTDTPYRMCEYALINASLLHNEATMMFRFMLNEYGEKNMVLSRLLPVMPSYYDARQLLNKSLGKDIHGRVQLRILLGPMYGVYLGNPTGFYTLYLSKESDVTCLRLLFDYSRRAMQQRKEVLQLGDTSQHGNWNCFRNAVLDGDAIVVTEEWFSSMPDKGKLEFDFFYFQRPHNREPLSAARFSRLQKDVNLMPVLNRSDSSSSADESGHDDVADALEENYSWNAHTAEAEFMLEFMTWCESNKSSRQSISFPKQILNSSKSRPNTSDELGSSKSSQQFHSPTPHIQPSRTRSYSVAHRPGDNDLDFAADAKEKKRKAELAKIWNAEFITEAIGNATISCRQLSLLLKEFNQMDDIALFNDMMKRPFGTIKVEVLINVFNNISDPANINTVLQWLSPFERAALCFRIGILNLWSSVHPDGFYTLNLAKREDKQLLKILLTLSASGSQDEFTDVDFRPDGSNPEDAESASRDIAKSWRSERNIPEKGTLSFCFTSDSNATRVYRQQPDSLHSEMLSLLYSPPLGNPSGSRNVQHSLKKTTILASNVGVKYNFESNQKRLSQVED